VKFRVELSRRAYKSLKKLPRNIKQEIVEKLIELQITPIPRGALKLGGAEDVYRIRVGKFRILYKLIEEENVILIFKIELRRRAYRR